MKIIRMVFSAAKGVVIDYRRVTCTNTRVNTTQETWLLPSTLNPTCMTIPVSNESQGQLGTLQTTLSH